MEHATGWALAAALALAVLHVAARMLTFLDALPRSRWLSLASGISVAYVFVHLLPELAQIQRQLGDFTAGFLPNLERHALLLALAGLAAFYGLEQLARGRGEVRNGGDHPATPDTVGWIHLGSYTAYNGIVGYLLVDRAQAGVTDLVLFTVAMGVHFVVNDHGLREDHGHVYHDYGRWAVGGGTLAGWALSAAMDVSETAIGLLIALLAGGIILNVLKEELPEQRQSRFLPFASGAAAYTALLLTI